MQLSNGDAPTSRGDYAHKWSHIDYSHLVRSTNEFIVFIDNNGDLDWETTVDYDERNNNCSPDHSSVIADAALLEATPCDGLRPEVRTQFKRLIGESIVCSLEHDYIGASKMLKASQKYIQDRSEELSRYWYLLASSLMAIPFMLAGLAIWLWRAEFIRFVGESAMWLALASAAGAAGALLSVIARSGNLNFDCSSGRKLHYLEAGSRIWAGALSGLLVALAVKANIILGAMAKGDQVIPVTILAAFVAGTGERLVSSIISKFDTPNLSNGSTTGTKITRTQS